MQDFAMIIQPGLENAAQQELEFWKKQLTLPIEEVVLFPGVVEYKAPLYYGLMLNQVMKTPTRILLRVKSFRCKDFPKFFRMMAKIEWKNFGTKYTPKWEVSTEGSRLSIKKRIVETCEDAYQKYWKQFPESSQSSQLEQKIYIRFVDDTCLVSIDTSGHESFKRGIRQFTEDAPLRENIAAALLWTMFGQEFQQLNNDLKLWDPMMGSGCFILEAATLFSTFQEANFNFHKWKFKRELLNITISYNPFCELIGSDLYEKAVESANKNLAFLTDKFPQTSSRKIDFHILDFFENIVIGDEKSFFMIFNPPYNKRLSTKVNPNKFFDQMFAHFDKLQQCKKIGVLVPQLEQWNPKLPKNWKLEHLIKTTNGGIVVYFYIFSM